MGEESYRGRVSENLMRYFRGGGGSTHVRAFGNTTLNVGLRRLGYFLRYTALLDPYVLLWPPGGSEARKGRDGQEREESRGEEQGYRGSHG